MITTTLFPAPSKAGRILEELLKASLDEMIKNLGLPSCQLTVIKNATQYDMLKAVLNDDLIIFDGSLEYDDDGNWCKQYECATANVISNDNILVVSRTALPINFMPFRTNVPAFGSENDGKNLSFSIDSIIDWLKSELNMMKCKERLPRNPLQKFVLPPFGNLRDNYQEVIKKNEPCNCRK